MPWFKVDDHLATHMKVVKAGNAAMGLWVRAGSWSSQHLTNGVIPTEILPILGTPPQARSLVTVGLWEMCPSGWQFCDWGDYQPSAERVDELREKRREAGRKGGLASGQTRAEGKQS